MKFINFFKFRKLNIVEIEKIKLLFHFQDCVFNLWKELNFKLIFISNKLFLLLFLTFIFIQNIENKQ